MKYLILVLLLLTGCADNPDPRFVTVPPEVGMCILKLGVGIKILKAHEHNVFSTWQIPENKLYYTVLTKVYKEDITDCIIFSGYKMPKEKFKDDSCKCKKDDSCKCKKDKK